MLVPVLALVLPVGVMPDTFIMDSGNSNSKSSGKSSGAGGMGWVSAEDVVDGEDEDSDDDADGIEVLSWGMAWAAVAGCVLFPGLDVIESKEDERVLVSVVVVVSGSCFWL